MTILSGLQALTNHSPRTSDMNILIHKYMYTKFVIVVMYMVN